MNLLGLDYGRAKVGVAISSASLAQPLEVIKYKNTDNLCSKIAQIIKDHNIDKIVIGLSESAMMLETKNFGQALGNCLNMRVEFFDETLTSLDAQRLSQSAGIKRKKRKLMEDAYAAAIMLQGYLDSN